MNARRSKSLAQLERDAALTRVSRTRRFALVAAAALTAGFAALVSAIAPGHSLGAKSAAAATFAPQRVASKSSPRLQMPPLASASALGLQGPSESPQPAAQPAPSQPAPSQSAPSNQAQSVPAPSPVPAPAPAPAVTSGGS